MEVLWENGSLSTRDIIQHLPDTTSHFNTIATYIRRLEQHGMIKHQELSPRFYTYQAAVSREQYVSYINKESITRFFDGSYMDFISRLSGVVGMFVAVFAAVQDVFQWHHVPSFQPHIPVGHHAALCHPAPGAYRPVAAGGAGGRVVQNLCVGG